MTAYIDFSTGRPPARHHRPQRAVAVPGKRSWWATDGQCALWVALGANLGCCGCYSSMFQVGLPPVRGGYFDVRIRGFDSRPGSAGHLCRAPRLRPVLAACGKPDRPAWMGSASAGHAQLAPRARARRLARTRQRCSRSSLRSSGSSRAAQPCAHGATCRYRRHTTRSPADSSRTVLIGPRKAGVANRRGAPNGTNVRGSLEAAD